MVLTKPNKQVFVLKALMKSISRQEFALFISYVLIASLIYSKFALSVCMIALLVVALFELDWTRPFPLRFNSAFRQNLRRTWEYRPYLALSLYFFLVFFSGFGVEDQGYWLERLRIKIPFLLAPFAFASLPPLHKKQYYGIFYFLLVLLTFTALQVSVHYLQNFTQINELMGKGHPMPTPMNHIRYSLLLTLGILGGVYLSIRKFYWQYPWERYLIIGLTLFLFAFTHILSVRSGLLALYLALTVLSLGYVLQTGKIKYAVICLIVLIGLPLVAYQHVPSFRAKARYTIYDMEMYLAGEEGKYSDSERIISLQFGMELGRQNPWTGVGAGDLRQEMHRLYEERYPDLPHKMPHNQLVSIFAGTGLVGLLVFCFAFFFPLFYQRNYRDPMLSSLHLIIFISFLMENTLETSVGVALYLIPLLLGLNYLSSQSPSDTKSSPE